MVSGCNDVLLELFDGVQLGESCPCPPQLFRPLSCSDCAVCVLPASVACDEYPHVPDAALEMLNVRDDMKGNGRGACWMWWLDFRARILQQYRQ